MIDLTPLGSAESTLSRRERVERVVIPPRPRYARRLPSWSSLEAWRMNI
jgi:hypothetical protein